MAIRMLCQQRARVYTARDFGGTMRSSPLFRSAMMAAFIGNLALAGIVGREAELQVWAAPEGFKIDRFGKKIFVLDPNQNLAAIKTKNSIWDSATRTLSLQGARGETVAFQLGIEGGAAGLDAVDVRVSALTGPAGRSIAANRFERFKIYYTEVNDRGSGPTNGPTMGKGWYPDALVPWSVGDTDAYGGYDGPPFRVSAGEIQGVWLDLTVPYGTPAGTYSGTMAVRSAGNKTTLMLTLRVLDFDIPRKIHNTFFMNFSMADLNQAGGGWLAGTKLTDYEQEVYRAARRHRFTAGNMYSMDMPRFEETPEGELKRVDWSAYDAAHDKVLSPARNIFGPGEDAIEIWRVPLFTGINSGPGKVPKGKAAWGQMVQEITRHWRGKGWDVGRAYVYLADEPPPSSIAVLDELARLVKTASGGALGRQVALNGALLGDAWATQQPVFDSWKDNVDMWLVSGSNYSVPHMSALPPGARRGMYQGGEPYQGNETLDADGVALRTWSWIAWQYRIDFLCYYSMSEAHMRAIPDPKDPNRFIYPDGPGRYNNDNEIWDRPRTRPWGVSQGVFIYPGKRVNHDLPIVNIRMKQIRRGQTDFEYFWLLKQAGEGPLADRLVKSVIKVALSEASERPEWFGYGKWSHCPDDWAAALAAAAARLEELKDRLPTERADPLPPS